MRGVPLLTHPDKKRARRFGGSIVERAPVPSELKWHIALAQAIRTKGLLSPGWRMTHFPAGGERSARSAGIMKLMGLEPGWPDLLFARPPTTDCRIGLLHGLELKRLRGEASNEQDVIGAWFLAAGWPYACVDRIEDAWRVLWSWGAIRLRVMP